MFQFDKDSISRLNQIPEDIGPKISIQKLYLCWCSRFMKILQASSSFTSLQRLHIDVHSRLAKIPEAIGTSTSLPSRAGPELVFKFDPDVEGMRSLAQIRMLVSTYHRFFLVFPL